MRPAGTTGPYGSLHVRPPVHARPPAIPLEEALRRGREERATGPRYVQDALAVDLAAANDEQIFGRQPTLRSELPDPQQWAVRVGQALLEVMAGARSAPQLVRWTSPEVYAVVARRGALAARRSVGDARPRPGGGTAQPPRPVVRRVLVCEPADGVAEVALVLTEGDRGRALAMRLVGLDGRWRVEALQVG